MRFTVYFKRKGNWVKTTNHRHLCISKRGGMHKNNYKEVYFVHDQPPSLHFTYFDSIPCALLKPTKRVVPPLCWRHFAVPYPAVGAGEVSFHLDSNYACRLFSPQRISLDPGPLSINCATQNLMLKFVAHIKVTINVNTHVSRIMTLHSLNFDYR